MLARLQQLLRRSNQVPASPVSARHSELSMLYSADDDPARMDDSLLDLALASANAARHANMDHVVERMVAGPYYPNVWPGEHYKLLAGILQQLKPKLVLEIGTYTGMSALSMLPYLPSGARIVTFDVIPWQQIPGTLLKASDFEDGRLHQVIADLSIPSSFETNLDLLLKADFLFVDGPKDGRFEDGFLQLLRGVATKPSLIIAFDDIRLWNMLGTWRRIASPKLDVTSFGHWSGTGLVHWSGEGNRDRGKVE